MMLEVRNYRDDIKDHTISFACGMAFPLTELFDLLTRQKMKLSDKLKEVHDMDNRCVASDGALFMGTVVSGMGMFFTTVAGVAYVYDHLQKDSMNVANTECRSTYDASADKKKIQKAAAAAGIVTSDFENCPR